MNVGDLRMSLGIRCGSFRCHHESCKFRVEDFCVPTQSHLEAEDFDLIAVADCGGTDSLEPTALEERAVSINI